MEDKLISSQWLINDLLNKSFYPAIVKSSIESAPAVDVVTIDELLELRDNLYETDGITMKGLKMLNELIAIHDGGRKENGWIHRTGNGYLRNHE